MQYSQRLGEAGRNDRRSMRGAFRPGLLPTLVVLGLLPVLLWLGTWQLQRADEKRALLASYEARRGAEPVSPGQLEGLRDPAYVRVRLHGRFDQRHTLLLDNRLRNGQAGVEVLQPFYDQPAAFGCWSTAAGSHGLTDARRRRWKPPTASSCSTPGPTCRHPAACTWPTRRPAAGRAW